MYLVPIVLATGCLCVGCSWFLMCALPRRRRKRQLKAQVSLRARTVSTIAKNWAEHSKTEDLRSASAAALRSARDRLAAGFVSQTAQFAVLVHDSEAEEAATQEIEARSVVAFLRNEQGHHL